MTVVVAKLVAWMGIATTTGRGVKLVELMVNEFMTALVTNLAALMVNVFTTLREAKLAVSMENVFTVDLGPKWDALTASEFMMVLAAKSDEQKDCDVCK